MAQIFLGYAEPYDKISSASSNFVLWTAHNLRSLLDPIYRSKIAILPSTGIVTTEVKEQTKQTLREAVEKSIKQALKDDAKPSLVKEMMNSNFSTEQIQAMIMILFVAGQDNVSTSLTHILLKLAQSQELQDKIRQDRSDPMESKVIRALLCESLRMLCPVLGIGRQVAKPSMLTLTHPESDRIISQTFIPEGSQLSTMNQYAAMDPGIYPEPEKFDINRHMQQSSFLPGLPHLPFGHGAHLCPGWDLYYAISAMTVSHLVKNYVISTTFKGEPKTELKFVTRLTDTIPISLKPFRASS